MMSERALSQDRHLDIITRPLQNKACQSPQFKRIWARSVRDYLVYRTVLGQADLDAAIDIVANQEIELEALLLNRYHISREELGEALSRYYRCPLLSFDEHMIIEPGLMKNLSLDYLKEHAWIPLQRNGTAIHIVANDPQHYERVLDIQRAFPGAAITFSVGLRRDIERLLTAATSRPRLGSLADTLGELAAEAGSQLAGQAERVDVSENDSAIVRLVNQIIAEAHRVGASDIHVEPYAGRKDMSVRFRVDGTCFTSMNIPSACWRAFVSRIKIMANLDIAESRKPQDGKIRFTLAHGHDIELRVATLPTSGDNEDVVLRLLSMKETMPLESMEFSPGVLQAVKHLSETPYGIILCVGPTGSGKTTTLHAVLKHINTDERKIWTAEDPVEITQEGLRQVQVHPKIGFTFAAAMRAFLRADPDVIMIGEMRDKETADIAIEASLTGHLVLSTLHTNSAVETVTRLLDMGCDPFNFADAMRGILAQRLCKKICAACSEAYRPSRQEYDELAHGYGTEEWAKLGIAYPDLTLHRGRGCDSCNRTGFKGRVAIHELLIGTEEIKSLIQSRARTAEILGIAMNDGMVTLLQSGIQKVLKGVTTYRQVRAVAKQ
ncbi:MAG: GspE/PulE family protein [Nitrospira sp.]|nr:GspE/PulE family protein [Nitrospira sp.]